MNIAGLNKLALAPQAPKSPGKNASKEAPSSFEDVLGQKVQSDQKVQPDSKSQADSKPQTEERRPNSAVIKNSANQIPVPGREARPERPVGELEEVSASDADSSGIPSQPTSPILDNPSFTERVMPSPTEVSLVNPMTKPTVGVSKEDDPAVDALTRRAVWNTFLKKMKDELGVSAEDVLEAFDSLSPEDLAKPPEQTIDKVVMALGLSADQTQLAKRHFLDLIDRTKARSMGEEISQSEKQISLTLMSQRELDRKSQSKAIDNLNQNFFMKGPYERPLAAPAAQEVPAQSLKAQTAPDMPVEAPVPMSAQPPVAKPGAFAIPKELQQASAKPAKADVDAVLKKFTEGQGQSEQVLKAGEESALKAFANSAPAAAAAAAAAPAVSVAPAKAAAEPVAAAAPDAMAAINSLFGAGKRASADAETGDEEQFTRDASYLGNGMGLDGANTLQNGRPSEFQQQLNTVAPNQPVAVPDLIKNAQVMVRDGGGEMKVTLTPDGLGEVAMKVSVKDGKVNVQMITESDEAKRMIERSLGELKTQLAHNQLQVADIKIDTASNLGKQLEQQYNDAQRQMAQQNLEQFRQDHQGWRRSFFEVPGAKVYKNQGEAPRDVQAPTSVAARSRAGARRLDLVA